MELQKKIVVVTGAASGIGLGLAARFVREGAIVIGSDLGAATGTAKVQAAGARFVAADVGKEQDIEALVDDVMRREGRIDVFCSNAGIGLQMDGMASQAAWDKILNVNLMSHVWAARHVLPHMLERGEGYLLNTSSAAGLLSEVESVGYATTKHAAVGFAEWLAFTYAKRGVRVSVLCPEGVKTPILDGAPYLRPTAITVEELAETVVQAMREERFMIVTHPTTLPALQRKAANYDGFIRAMGTLREKAEQMKRDPVG